MIIYKGRIFLALAFVTLGVLGRTVFHIYPNVEVVTALSLLSAVTLGGWYRVFVPLGILFLSDLLIGNTSIFVFTWSAYLLIGLSGTVLRRFQKKQARMVFAATGLSMVSSMFFYGWTNFGVWLIGGLYPPTASGLLQSYAMGLPFLRFNLAGNLLLVPLIFVTYLLALRLVFRQSAAFQTHD